MAMLAEPRRKQKVINLRAKNNAWSNDSSKFGQRMLEKMGWTSGKGLGANENGITEHVVARYKNDEKGLGFEDKNDQWVKHEDDFNALLANLSNENDKSEMIDLHSGISLEDKSKKSKARIHYHKFTRGKDISRYSEKDLANIFGKKSFKSTKEIQKPLNEDLKTTEQIFTEKGSMEDYFKNKLSEIKSKSKFKAPAVNDNGPEHDEPSYGFHGFSQNNDKVESDEIDSNLENKTCYVKTSFNYDICDSDNFTNTKRMSKTHENDNGTYNNDKQNSYNAHEQHLNPNQQFIDGKIKKKKLKNKMKIDDNNTELECSEEKIKKSKSKNKHELVQINAVESITDNANGHEVAIQSVSDTDQTHKNKKKSKKHAHKEFSNIDFFPESSERRKKKKNKNKELEEENFPNVKSKKSKRDNIKNVEQILQNTVVELLPKKKKKKCKDNH